VVHDLRRLELHGGRSGNGVERLSGGVRDQVQIDTLNSRGRVHGWTIQGMPLSGERYPSCNNFSRENGFRKRPCWIAPPSPHGWPTARCIRNERLHDQTNFCRIYRLTREPFGLGE
jgi:hypothetical protein